MSEGRLEELGAENFGRAEAICARLDALRSGPGEPAAWNIFALKILLDALSARALQLAAIMSESREITYFPDVADAPDLRLPIPDDAALYAELAPRVAGLVGAHLSAGPASEAPQVPAPAPRGRFAALADGLRARARDRRAVGGRRADDDSPVILFADYQYNLPPIARAVEEAGMCAYVWWGGAAYHRLGSFTSARHDVPEPVARGQFAELWERAAADDELRALFAWEGLDLFEAFTPRLRRMVCEEFAAAVDHFTSAGALMERLKPAAVLLSTPGGPSEKALCAAARAAGVPAVVSTHGAFGIRLARMDWFGDLDAVDWALCWGSLEQAAWRHEYARRPVRTTVTGAPMVEEALAKIPVREDVRERLGLDPDERVVLYVPTTLSGNWWYAGNRTPMDPVHFEHQASVLAELAAIEGARLVVKEHPAAVESVLEQWCAAHAPDAKIVRSPGFQDLIHLADVVVLDIPSTTVAQALFGMARIHVVGYPGIRWMPGVPELLAEHGIALCSSDDVGERVTASLRDPGPASYSDLAAQVVAPGPPAAAERAARAIRALVARPELREATMDDADLLREWRNDPSTLAASGNQTAVTVDEHARWLERLLGDPARHLLIAEHDGEPVGQVRFERENEAYVISVSLAADARGRGLGSQAIAAGVAWLGARAPGADVRALIWPANEPSLRAFGRAGFEPAGEDAESGMTVYRRSADPRL